MSAPIGGQAVLEGGMMRGPSNWAVAVRKPDGEIAHVSRSIRSPMARHWILRLPVIRGVVALGESLAIGFRALAISANYAAQEGSTGARTDGQTDARAKPVRPEDGTASGASAGQGEGEDGEEVSAELT